MAKDGLDRADLYRGRNMGVRTAQSMGRRVRRLFVIVCTLPMVIGLWALPAIASTCASQYYYSGWYTTNSAYEGIYGTEFVNEITVSDVAHEQQPTL